jgi:hypothetical protein
VFCFIDNIDVSEFIEVFDVWTKEVVMIAEHPCHLGALLGLFEDIFNDLVMTLMPVKGGFQSPAIDDITNQKKIFALDLFEECKKFNALASSGA